MCQDLLLCSQMSQVERYRDLEGINKISESNYKFDEAGRLTELTHNSDGEIISAYDWAYDAANRITQAVSPDGVSDYNYDDTDQLIDASHDYQDNENYSYDDNGNRVGDGYVTGDNNQLLSDGTYNYEYDAEGNRVRRVEIATGEVTEYSWDYRNRLVDVVTKDADGNVISNADYTYDVFDRRIGKSVDADGDGVAEKVERFVNDGDHIALTFDGDGNQTERFLHGARIDEVIAQENADGEVLWALTDNLGSVRVLLDNDGNVINEIIYDAFGNVTVKSDPDVNFRFGYTGRELDEETGLYYYRSRYYDPAVGQFINEDTIGFAGGDANLYRYTFNSPLNYRDPDGKLVWAIPVAVGTAIVVGGILYQLKKSTEALVEDLPKVFPKDNPFPEPDPNQKPKKPKEPPLAPWIEETDPLKINPEKKNDDFFNPDKPDSWFDQQKELIEEVKEENDKKEEDNNSGTCPAPWASNDNNPDPQASNEPQNSGDGQPKGSQNDDSDSGHGQDGDADSLFDNIAPSAEQLDDIAKITDKYKNLECVQCANDIQKYAIENGIPGTRIILETGFPEFIVDDSLPPNHDAISDNGRHEGVEFTNSNGEKIVFDNHHRTPVPTDEWIDNLFFPSKVQGNQFRIERKKF